MTNETLYLILILLGGMVSLIGLMIIPLVVQARGRKDELTTFAEQVFQGLVNFTDKALVPLGPQLRPLHDAVAIGSTLVDDTDDWLIQLLATRLQVEPQVVVESLTALFRGGLQWTDGLPPEGDPGEGSEPAVSRTPVMVVPPQETATGVVDTVPTGG